jgi:hypothetical protein
MRRRVMAMQKFEEFIKIAEYLNHDMGIIPVLYGSLGLQMISETDFYPDDIDILIPAEFLKEKWDVFRKSMKRIGYELVDLHEHEFIRNDIKIAFSFIEDLERFADVNYNNLEIVYVEGVKYKRLNLQDYLKVYLKSSMDSYRSNKNND